MENNYAVIMAGGVGSRFWPLSTEEKPKQFLDVLGIGKTLIQMTFERLLKIAPSEQIYILTNEKYVDLIKKQLPAISADQILTEPMRKNTAPCITYAAAKIHQLNSNAAMIVAPSDHVIIKEERFASLVERGLEEARENGSIVTLGIKPTRPDTGYGYIQFSDDEDVVAGQVKKVKQFMEKPNKSLAEIFLKSGNYFWNSGIFIWKTRTILDAIAKFKPLLFEQFCSNPAVFYTPAEYAFIADAFQKCEDVSIDYAVLENAKNVSVVLSDFDWSDLGTWNSLYDYKEPNLDANVIFSNDKVQVIDSKDCLINIEAGYEAIVQGLNNHIVVLSNGKLLILDKDNEQNLKKYLQA
ncbi:MAG: mannose-1-phosphate guanylyltransferase [Crocinitomicaceae bacterium]|nr:mannose-1-phosphate guanylyltransferase [Crocinitomicaceae bacterium]